MISADFYPTERTFTNGQITKYFPLYNQSGSNYLEITESEAPDMYYLGWIKWENTPSTFLMSESKNHEVNGTDYNTMTMTTTPSNFNIGYLGNFENLYTPPFQNAFNASYVDTMWKQSVGTDTNAFASRGFVNRFAVSAINYSYLTVGYVACTPNANVTTRYYATQNINAEDFETWKESTQTLTFNNLGEVTVDNNVLNEQFYQDVDINGATYRIFIYTYAPFQDRPMNSNNDVDAYTWITPFLNVNGSGTGPGVPSSGTEFQILTSAQSATIFNYTSDYGGFDINWGSGYNKNTYRYFPNGGMGCSQVLHDENWTYEIYPSGFSGKIDYNWASSFTVIGFYFDDDPNSNFFLLKDRNDFCQLGRMFKPFDIIHHMSLLPRWKAKSTDAATFGVQDGIYYPEVLPTNEFTGRLITGTRAELLEVLRPWQIDADYWDSNDYTPEDLPPYEPEPGPGPTPQETEPKYPGYPTLGSATRYVPTAGVNFYALNNSLVATFVQRLWSQPKNFYEAIQIAGNQVDSIFDYIQSFRYYPLNYDFSGSITYPVIFGTGAVLKDADGDTNFQLSEATPIQDTIAAGDWNLSDPIYHWRNNFLDYSPYLKMSIYLPFAGTIELSPEAVASHTDISAATITLLASFDIETGTITYYVINQANVLLAQKTAKVAIDLPLSGNNSAEQSAAILRAQFSTVKQLLGAGTSAATGAATSGLAGVASATVSTLSSVGDMYLQNSLAQRAVPVEVQGMGGTLSALAGGQYPYITINRQKVSNPPNYAHTTGYLVEGTYKISILNGFTVCRNTDVSGINQATDKEKAQIKQILESGFYA